MRHYLIAFLVLLHGSIHLIGFVKAFDFANITQLSKDISRPLGIAWLLTALIFMTTSILLFTGKDNWRTTAIIGTIISQILVITVWKDARYATGMNLLLAIFAVTASNSFLF